MAININELYKFVQFVSNKEQSGYIKPSEFNIAVDRAQMQLFMERYNNPADDGQFWEFTVNVTTGMPDYNPATSTNLNWSNELFNEIGIRILSFCSVNLKDTTLTQYSELKKQQGI